MKQKLLVSMTTCFAGVSTEAVTHAPYKTKFTIRPDVPKGIYFLMVTGVSGNASDKCYLCLFE